jgi:hypothetical protein
MAIFKSESINIEFSYHDIDEYGIIEYCCNISIGGEHLFNPIFFQNGSSKKGFIFSLDETQDIFMDFFLTLFKSRKGNSIGDVAELFSLKAETWFNKKEKAMENWKGKTVMVKDKNETKEEDYTSVMNELFVPLLEEQIDLTLDFTPRLLPNFNRQYDSSHLILLAQTNFDNLAFFTADLIKEQTIFLKEKGLI